MTSPMTERLRLEVDADTAKGENAFDRLGRSADDTAKRAKASGEEVAAAADRVAQARLREQDAAGKLSVAETRLQEARDRYAANSSQVAAAEERVEAAQRRVQAASGATTRAVEEQARVQASAAEASTRAAESAGRNAGETERMGRANAFAREQVRGLAVAAGALVGFGLAEVIRDSADAFVAGARDAGNYSRTLNSTVEQAGQLGGLVNSIGLDFDDLIEIQAEFAQKVSANGRELADLGVTIARNADGTINWATTLTDTLGVLQDIPDATERNRIGFQYFGEEGYKQLSRLVNSGVSVADALEQIGTPFTADDVAKAAEYDAKMRDLSLTGTSLQQSLGRALIPLVVDLADGLTDVVDVVTAIPLPLAAATAGAIALGVTGFNPAAAAGARLATVLPVIRTEIGLIQAAMISGGAAAGGYGAALGAATRGASGLAGVLGGPLGIGLILGAGAYVAYNHGLEEMKRRASEAAPALTDLAASLGSVEQAIAQQASDLDDGAGYWERFSASVDAGVSPLYAIATSFSDLNQTTAEQVTNLAEARDALGEYGAQQQQAQVTTKTLTELIAEGTTSGADFANAVQAAAQAQAAQAQTSGLAEAAIAAYTAQTTGAVEATLGLINAQFGVTNAGFAFLQALDAANAAVDDQATSVNEVDVAYTRLYESALSGASAAADAAVAAAQQAGQIVTPLSEASIRADALISDLQARLNTPGLTDGAKAGIQALIVQLQTAKENGNIEATLTTLGVGEARSEIDGATEDRDTTISVESRGGPAVIAYLDGIASAMRLALIMVESRGGPAADSYIDGIAAQARLALIMVESRGGPAVDDYLDSLARTRTAVIQVRQQAVGAPVAVPGGPTGAAMRGAPQLTGVGGGTVLSSLAVDLEIVGRVPAAALSAAERGQGYIRDIQAAERQGGAGWRKRP